MKTRYLGGSGMAISGLSFGTGTSGGVGDFFSAWRNLDVANARRLIDICLDAGVTLSDTADSVQHFLARSK